MAEIGIKIEGLDKVTKNLSPLHVAPARRRFLTRVALIVERNAKKRARVRTGHMRRSITYQVQGDRAIVGTNVKYAPFQEFGTRYITPNRFLRGGLEDSQGAIRREIGRFEKEIVAAMGGA